MKKILVVAFSFFFLVACDQMAAAPKKMTEAQKAQKAADSIQFSSNAERENITRRLKLTSNPGLAGFILLLNEMGQPIMYSGVKGKITSGGKRLTPPAQSWNHWNDGASGAGKGGVESGALGPAPSDEGTWGSSNPYVYFWTANGQYIQWNGKYLYSDKPFRTKIEPLVINVESTKVTETIKPQQ